MPRPKTPCYHCGGAMRVVMTSRISETVTERTYQCQNEKGLCGFRVVCAESPMRVLLPPVNPKPGIDIPMTTSTRVKQRLEE